MSTETERARWRAYRARYRASVKGKENYRQYVESGRHAASVAKYDRGRADARDAQLLKELSCPE